MISLQNAWVRARLRVRESGSLPVSNWIASLTTRDSNTKLPVKIA